MKRALLLVLLALPLLAQAQTYFYVNTITITPSAPTTSDAITITLDGDLASTGTYVLNTSWGIVGNVITCTVNCGQGIGLDVLVPHSETFNIGMLTAGTYTVALSGTGMGDFAPSPQHQFTVAGGGGAACDSLIIDYLRWSPFSDSTLELHVFNYSNTLFDYPGFVLLDQNNDTLAKETVNTFGIPTESWHTLTIQPGAVIPQGIFSGTLHLWTDFYMDEACIFNFTGDLCPGSCVNLFPDVSGSPLAPAEFTWLLQDNLGTDVATGTLHLDPLTSSDVDTVCLPPGNYVLYMNCATVPGGVIHYGFSTNWTNHGDHQDSFVQGGEPNILTIPFYTPCIDPLQNIEDHAQHAWLSLAQLNDAITITRSDGLALGDLSLIDASGRAILTMHSSNASAMMNVGLLSNGLYTVVVLSGGRSMVGRVVLSR